MADWCLLVIDNKSHLVNLDSKIIEIKNFGNFPSEFLKGQKKVLSLTYLVKKVNYSHIIYQIFKKI